MVKIKVPDKLHPSSKIIDVGIQYDDNGRIIRAKYSLYDYFQSLKRTCVGNKHHRRRNRIYSGNKYSKNENSGCGYALNDDRIYEMEYDKHCRINKNGELVCDETFTKDYILSLYKRNYQSDIKEFLDNIVNKYGDILSYDKDKHILKIQKDNKISEMELEYDNVFSNIGSNNDDYMDVIFNDYTDVNNDLIEYDDDDDDIFFNMRRI